MDTCFWWQMLSCGEWMGGGAEKKDEKVSEENSNQPPAPSKKGRERERGERRGLVGRRGVCGLDYAEKGR